MVTSIKSPVLGCLFSMYLSNRKEVKYGYCKHNHPLNPDLFSYFVHRTRRIGHDKVPKIVKSLRREVSYNKARRILKNHDLRIERQQFYNITRAEASLKIKSDKEPTLLLATLDHKDLRVRVNDIYQTNEAGIIVSCELPYKMLLYEPRRTS